MSTLHERIRTGLRSLAARHRIVIADAAAPPRPASHAASILSRVAYVLVNEAPHQFRGRARTLHFVDEADDVSIIARTRPLPGLLDPQQLTVVTATDWRAQEAPLVAVDRRARTIHLLVELERARTARGSRTADPTPALLRRLYEQPILAMLAEDGEPIVGPQVSSEIRHLLEAQPTGRDAMLRSELEYLTQMEPHLLPDVVRRRVDMLKRRLSEQPQPAGPRKIEDSRIADELQRLTRLASSRAVGFLELSSEAIIGLVNPIAGRGWVRKPILFRLQQNGLPPWPVLSVRNPLRSDAGWEYPCCMGLGDAAFRRLQRDGDLYGLVDVVLNYIETNQLGVVSG